jgi:hypothetical protein
MEIDLALLADAATVDAAGKLNILGVFDRLAARGFPVKHGRVTLILRFAAGLQEAGGHRAEIRLLSPDGSEIVRLNGEMQLDPGPMAAGGMIRVPHIINLDGLVFPRAGQYTFEVRVDGEHHVSIPLTVSAAGPAGAQA